MKVTKNSRLRVPAVMMVLGSAIAVAVLIGTGWAAAIPTEAITVLAVMGYYALGGRDSDRGAMIGARADERQANNRTRAQAMAGLVMSVVALGGFIVTTALGRPVWPFMLFAGVGAASFLAGLVIYRDQ